MPEIPRLLPFTGVCASGRRPRVRWTVTIDASQIRFVSLAEEPERGSGSARKADCRVRRIEAVGFCDAGGRFSRNLGPPATAGSSSSPSVSRCSWRAFHDVPFYCCDLSPARMCQGRQGRAAREGFAPDREKHVRRPIHAPLQNCNVSGADGRPRGIRFRQTVLGGVLGGNLAFYTMITSRTGLQVAVQSIKRRSP
jgi:hypothetical protein